MVEGHIVKLDGSLAGKLDHASASFKEDGAALGVLDLLRVHPATQSAARLVQGNFGCREQAGEAVGRDEARQPAAQDGNAAGGGPIWGTTLVWNVVCKRVDDFASPLGPPRQHAVGERPWREHARPLGPQKKTHSRAEHADDVSSGVISRAAFVAGRQWVLGRGQTWPWREMAGDGMVLGAETFFFSFSQETTGNVWVKRTKVAIARARGRVHQPRARGTQALSRPSFSGASSNIKASCKAQFNESVSQSYAHRLESSAIRTHCNLAGHDLSIMASKTQPPSPPFHPDSQGTSQRRMPFPMYAAPPNASCGKKTPFFGPPVPE